MIDTHQHVFWHGRDDAGLIADMDEHGIELAWLLTWEIIPRDDYTSVHPFLNPCNVRADGTHAGITLADILKARDRYPNRFVAGYCPDPLKPSAPGLLEAAHRIHGVRICGEWKFRILIDDPRCIELFRKAGELAMPVVLHLDVPYLPKDGAMSYYPSWYGGTVENLERVLQACPQTNFIGHAPGFWREISAHADQEETICPSTPVAAPGKISRLLNAYPNLFADLSANSGLSALKRDPGHAADFICRHADRLLFGRDYYGGDLWKFLQSLNLPDEVLLKITRLNAQKLLPPL